MSAWDSDSRFGFTGSSAGGNLGTAATPAATAQAPLQPSHNAAKNLLDPKGSAIFWVAVFAALGLAMVSGQLKVSAALNARGGRR